jgi:hypothetical protein
MKRLPALARRSLAIGLLAPGLFAFALAVTAQSNDATGGSGGFEIQLDQSWALEAVDKAYKPGGISCENTALVAARDALDREYDLKLLTGVPL